MNKNLEDNKSKAQKIVAHMFERDQLAKHFGIKIVDAGEGFAQIAMKVRSEMLNGHGICHGGVTFALADTAFAYACNSRNQKTVALNCTISFSQAVFEGDELTALAKEQILNRRTGTYDVTITNQSDQVVALFRGSSYAMKQHVVSDSEL